MRGLRFMRCMRCTAGEVDGFNFAAATDEIGNPVRELLDSVENVRSWRGIPYMRSVHGTCCMGGGGFLGCHG